jgi:hypothetical protein
MMRAALSRFGLTGTFSSGNGEETPDMTKSRTYPFSSEQLQEVVDDMRPLLGKDQLVELAVALAECPLPIPH